MSDKDLHSNTRRSKLVTHYLNALHTKGSIKFHTEQLINHLTQQRIVQEYHKLCLYIIQRAENAKTELPVSTILNIEYDVQPLNAEERDSIRTQITRAFDLIQHQYDPDTKLYHPRPGRMAIAAAEDKIKTNVELASLEKRISDCIDMIVRMKKLDAYVEEFKELCVEKYIKEKPKESDYVVTPDMIRNSHATGELCSPFKEFMEEAKASGYVPPPKRKKRKRTPSPEATSPD
jgi:hypothetical protein